MGSWSVRSVRGFLPAVRLNRLLAAAALVLMLVSCGSGEPPETSASNGEAPAVTSTGPAALEAGLLSHEPVLTDSEWLLVGLPETRDQIAVGVGRVEFGTLSGYPTVAEINSCGFASTYSFITWTEDGFRQIPTPDDLNFDLAVNMIACEYSADGTKLVKQDNFRLPVGDIIVKVIDENHVTLEPNLSMLDLERIAE